MRILSAKRALQVGFASALVVASVLLYCEWRSSPAVQLASDTRERFALNDEQKGRRLADSSKELRVEDELEQAKESGARKKADNAVDASFRGAGYQLHDARLKLHKIQAELANASDEAEIARLQRNERVMSRLVEHMQQIRGVPPGP